jgi:hypothetical protein
MEAMNNENGAMNNTITLRAAEELTGQLDGLIKILSQPQPHQPRCDAISTDGQHRCGLRADHPGAIHQEDRVRWRNLGPRTVIVAKHDGWRWTTVL